MSIMDVPEDLKLSYLPVRARGEAPRMMLKYYDVKVGTKQC